MSKEVFSEVLRLFKEWNIDLEDHEKEIEYGKKEK